MCPAPTATIRSQNMRSQSGKIVTFYSYKGGTGRTMALVNVAWVLASNGHKVLLIDWDLEAPGLHRYLRPFLVDQELSSTAGLIDYVWDVARLNMTPKSDIMCSDRDWPSLEDYVVGLDFEFAGNGLLAFIPAGRQDENYAQRVNTFNWDTFYERLGGGKLLEAQRNELRERYDYILIDSRTGVSDTSSICTVHMPDLLVVLFTLNRQSVNGACAVATSVMKQRSNIRIFPVPTRVESTESDKRHTATLYARKAFAPFLQHIRGYDVDGDAQYGDYWIGVETPYVPFYAFEEVPATFKDEPGGLRSILAASERITSWLTDHSVSALQPESNERRKEVVDAYTLRLEELQHGDEFGGFSRRSSISRAMRRLTLWLRRRGTKYGLISSLCILILIVGLSWIYSDLLSTKQQLLLIKRPPSVGDNVRDELTSTQMKLQDTENKLRDRDFVLRNTQSKLQDTETKLKDTESKAQDAESKFQGAESSLRAASQELLSSKNLVEELRRQLNAPALGRGRSPTRP
jgi:MinD-like ATPase involved in chromosome partitioning or flagellar assembly